MESVQTQLTDDNGDVSEVKGLAEIRTYMHSLMVGSYICSYRYHKQYQRETTIAWDSRTGEALHNALIWHDTRTQQIVDECTVQAGDRKEIFQKRTGLPFSTYFAAPKMKWLLENVEDVRIAQQGGTLMMGTVDSWLLWVRIEQTFR